MTTSVLQLGDGWFPTQPGGLNRYVRELHQALNGSVESRVLVLGPASDLLPGVTVVASRDDPLPERMLRLLLALRHTAADGQVIDTHFPLYALIPLLPPLRRAPRVAHFHGPWAEESRIEGERSRAKLAAKHLVEAAVYRRAHELVVLSGAFRRLLVERYGVAPWHVHVVPPGVDLGLFSPGDQAEARAKLGIPAGTWTAVTARRLVPRMGLDVLLEAWARLPSRERVLLVVGDGPSRAQLRAQAARLGTEDTVRFLGPVSDDVLVSCYRAANVSVVPSVAFEGFGLVLLESLACGTPVVASRVGGVSEVLPKLDSSLVLPAGSSSALAERLHSAMTAEGPLPDRASCRAFAAQFSWREVAARHREVYQRAAVRHARPRRLRVVYLDHCARLAGAELALVRLLGSLPDIQAHVILAEDGPLVARLLEAGVSVEVLPLGERARDLPRESVRVRALPLGTAFASAAYVTRLAWRLRRLRPDLVHASSLKACVYGGVAARLAGLPVVWHARDQMTPGWLPTTAIRLVRWLASRTASVVIADTQSTLLTLGLAHERGVVIPSPIDYERIASTTRERRKGGPLRIGVVGRIAPIKGQDLFLRAFAHAFPRGSERAVVVGAPLFGEEAFEHELRRLTHRLGATDRVEFRGFEADVAAALADLDVLVNSSVVPETLAQAVVEGMAARLPVVAPRDGGPAEVIEHDVTGVLYRAGDVEALSSELRRVAGDAALRRRLGESAQTRARQFAPDVVAPRVMSVYQRLARRERSAP